MAKRMHPHVLEKIISTIMVIFGIAAIWIFASSYSRGVNRGELAIIEILLIIVLGILAQTVVLIRIYEKHE